MSSMNPCKTSYSYSIATLTIDMNLKYFPFILIHFCSLVQNQLIKKKSKLKMTIRGNPDYFIINAIKESICLLWIQLYPAPG